MLKSMISLHCLHTSYVGFSKCFQYCTLRHCVILGKPYKTAQSSGTWGLFTVLDLEALL